MKSMRNALYTTKCAFVFKIRRCETKPFGKIRWAFADTPTLLIISYLTLFAHFLFIPIPIPFKIISDSGSVVVDQSPLFFSEFGSHQTNMKR